MVSASSQLPNFIAQVEKDYFRTDKDVGANFNTLFIWNLVREFAGFNKLKLENLPSYCEVHDDWHIIRQDYGCERG